MTGSGDAMTPLQAAEAMRDMERLDETLQRRVHGLTWLFWGVVAPAIFVTFSYAASEISDQAYGEGPKWFGLLWLPWALVGLLFTWMLWRSVGFALPGRGLEARELVIHAGLFLLATVGLVAVGLAADLAVYPPTIVLTGIGLVAAMLGARDAFGGGVTEGTAQAAVGVLLIAFAVSEAVVLGGPPTHAGLSKAALWNALASAVGLLGIGLFRVLRS